MSIALSTAAFLSVALALAHSVLGEHYILMPLIRKQDLPRFVSRTLRFAWHLTSIAWCGFAAVLVLLAHGEVSGQGVAMAIGATFALTGLVVLWSSRGRHPGWAVLGIIAVLTMVY